MKKCKIDNCGGLGRKHSNGSYYLVRGLCVKHYTRWSRGVDVNKTTVYDRRKAIMVDDTAKIPIGVNAKDGYAIIDKEFAYLDEYQWFIHSAGYAQTKMGGKKVYMHHKVIGKPKSPQVTDHINRNKLDNRLTNLRHVKYSDNAINTGLRSDNSTGHKGIYFVDRPKPWYAIVYRGNKIIYSKTFLTLEDAIVERRNFVDSIDRKTTD